MLYRKFLLLFLGVAVCLASDVRQNRACSDYELGPAQEFKATPDELLHLTWKPPLNFETCGVDYTLHIQNMNTSEYLSPVVTLTDLSYTFDYGRDDHTCIHLRATLYSNYEDQTSPTWAFTFLDPLVELGAPRTLDPQSTEEYLLLKWTTPEGYEKCYYYFMFAISISTKDGGHIANANVAGFEFRYSYYEDHPQNCKEVDVSVTAYFRGMPGGTITKSVIFGPPENC